MKQAFIETRARQEGYADRRIVYDEEQAKSLLQYLIIEAAEAIAIFAKPWHKISKPTDKQALLAEICDIILFAFAACSWLGISYEELEQAMLDKLTYNKTRKEHKI